MYIVCVIADNKVVFEFFLNLTMKKNLNFCQFSYFCSRGNDELIGKYDYVKEISLSECGEDFFSKYDLFISLHCKQIFPNKLVVNHRCVNIHPGYNPYNRGWYPHVFSIINGLPTGVTIHEMDNELDHGKIIVQREVEIFSDETSKDVYEKLIKTEETLLDEYLENIITGNYESYEPAVEGNINYKKDYFELCKLNMESVGTLEEHINLLRALSHGKKLNAYYFENGRKKFVKIEFGEYGGVQGSSSCYRNYNLIIGVKSVITFTEVAA